MSDGPNPTLAEELDSLHREICAKQRSFLDLVAEADRTEGWRGQGARDLAHWLSIRYGLSWWKAHRWVAAARALERLPRLAEALEVGELRIDKVVELARFATPETEDRLVRWAHGVSSGRVRRVADLAVRREAREAADPEAGRFVSWWYFDEGRRFGLEAELPAAQGAIVQRALERLAREIPAMPGEEDPDVQLNVGARRADALVALCSGSVGGGTDVDRATVVVHAPMDALASDDGSCEVEGGGVIPAATARRLLCNARSQFVFEDSAGNPVRLGRTTREPPAWMVRQLRHRDGECRFPRCGNRRYTEAHHVVWWRDGGRTDLDNLVLICSFHHRLVHEHGWSLTLDPDGSARWLRSDGRPYHAGPAPPRRAPPRRVLVAAAGL